jgi:hypothetical protein
MTQASNNDGTLTEVIAMLENPAVEIRRPQGGIEPGEAAAATPPGPGRPPLAGGTVVNLFDEIQRARDLGPLFDPTVCIRPIA